VAIKHLLVLVHYGQKNYQADVEIYGLCSTYECVSNLNSVPSVYDYINHALHVGMR
jgi:hypothetical protein